MRARLTTMLKHPGVDQSCHLKHAYLEGIKQESSQHLVLILHGWDMLSLRLSMERFRLYDRCCWSLSHKFSTPCSTKKWLSSSLNCHGREDTTAKGQTTCMVTHLILRGVANPQLTEKLDSCGYCLDSSKLCVHYLSAAVLRLNSMIYDQNS